MEREIAIAILICTAILSSQMHRGAIRLHNIKTIITANPVSNGRMETHRRVCNQNIAVRFHINRTICTRIGQTQIGLRKPSNQAAGFIKRIIRTIWCCTDRRPVTVFPPGSPCISLTRRNIPVEIARQTIEIFTIISLRFCAHTLTELFRIFRQILTGFYFVITVQLFSSRITNPPVLNRNNGRTINHDRIVNNTGRIARGRTCKRITIMVHISLITLNQCCIRHLSIQRIIISSIPIISRQRTIINDTNHTHINILRNIFSYSYQRTIRNTANSRNFRIVTIS